MLVFALAFITNWLYFSDSKCVNNMNSGVQDNPEIEHLEILMKIKMIAY
jgi:hypothetical protein